MAKALDSNQLLNTLNALKEAGLPQEDYNMLYKKAEELGIFNREFTSEEILAEPKPGYDRYGLGP